MKICLVCSSGGHFLQLYSLKESWSGFDHFWVTFKGRDTECMLKDERVFYSHSPTNRNIKNLVKNLFLAAKILKRERPDAVVSTGAGVAVPFIYIAKALGIKTIYIESITRSKDLSLSAKLVYFVTDELLVQWPELGKKYGRAKFKGQVL